MTKLRQAMDLAIRLREIMSTDYSAAIARGEVEVGPDGIPCLTSAGELKLHQLKQMEWMRVAMPKREAKKLAKRKARKEVAQ